MPTPGYSDNRNKKCFELTSKNEIGGSKFLILEKVEVTPLSGWENDPGYLRPAPSFYWRIWCYQDQGDWEYRMQQYNIEYLKQNSLVSKSSKLIAIKVEGVLQQVITTALKMI